MVRTTISRVIIVTFQTTTWFEFNQGLYSLFLTFFNSIQKKVVHIPSTCSGHATLLCARHTIFSFVWLPMTVLSLQQRWCGIIFEKFDVNWYLLKLLKVVHRLVKCNFNCFPAFSHQWVTVRWLRYWPGTTIFLIILYKLWWLQCCTKFRETFTAPGSVSPKLLTVFLDWIWYGLVIYKSDTRYIRYEKYIIKRNLLFFFWSKKPLPSCCV